MENKKILILGGYGNTGLALARLLLAESGANIILAGRRLEKAQDAADNVNTQFDGRRVSAAYADASIPESLAQALEGVDMIVVASGTAEYVREVATAALDAGVDYLDVQFSTQKVATLQAMANEIKAAGRCFITDGGFHPGLPAALIRAVAPQFDQLESARVGSVIKVDWAGLTLAPSTIDEFVSEFMDFQTLAYRDGQWRKTSWLAMMKPMTMDFGRRFGRQYSLPMFLEEMRAIPDFYPSIIETGFFVGGFNWFVDWLVSPVVMAALAIWPERAVRPMGRLMMWGLQTFSRPPYGTMLKVEANGIKDGRPKHVELLTYHEDGYAFTAIPTAACLLQWLDGSIHKPGLWLQAHAVEPHRLLVDMERMGVEVERVGE